MRGVIRRIVPWFVLPLALIATGLASSPWLRAFPSSVLSVPLFGAAVLSVLVPLLAVRLGARQLWASVLVDVVVFVGFSLTVVLHDPTGFAELARGLVRGPAQILSFALPLVSPRSLLMAPVALCWLTGALAGECLARRWYTMLPYGGWLIAFGLAYAGTVRAAVANDNDGRIYDTVLAGALLFTMLLLRVAQSWLRQDRSAESTQADSILPLRGLLIGVAMTLVIGLAAAGVTQNSAFSSQSTTPQRVPTVNKSQPLTPMAFIAGLRPSDPKAPGTAVFSVAVDRDAPAYLGLANVDFYDGDGWSFTRTFRPSGGVVPADADPALVGTAAPVTQDYRITGPQLAGTPWMPYLDRAQKVTGVSVNVDADSGMIVPTRALTVGRSYEVRSQPPDTSFAELDADALPATSAPPIDTQIPGALRAPLATLVSSLATETGTATSQPVAFLQALLADLHANYALAGAPTSSPSASPRSAGTAGGSTNPLAPASAGPSSGPRVGGTGFADVLASVLGPNRSATPEQYATLFTLVARQLGVPARVVTGFRVPVPAGRSTLAPGNYDVTTADAWTWVEIAIRNDGWAVVDPSPGRFGVATRQEVGAAPPSSSSAPPSRNALITQSNGGHAVAPKSSVPNQGTSPAPLAVIVALAVACVLALLLAFLLLRKWLRVRRRRGEPDHRLRLLGAWHESLDVLSEYGLTDVTALTSTEIAQATGAQFGPEPADHAAALGRAADAVVYSSATQVQAQDADTAWRSHAALRRLVRRTLPLHTRLAAGLRYHRARPAAPPEGPSSWASPREVVPSRRRWRTRYRGRRRAH